MSIKVNRFDEEVTSLYKNINEIKALQTLGGASLTNFIKGPSDVVFNGSRDKAATSNDMPKTVREVYGFWAITRQYFDDQARDFLRLLKSPSESSTYGYN